MDSQQLKLSELVSSRLCHDLITPIGAINTGLELLSETEEEGADKDEILALIVQSAKTASMRLAFYRVVFGSSGTQLTIEDARTLMERFAESSKINLILDNPEQIHGPGLGRFLITLFLWAQESMPRGGTMKFNLTPGPGITLHGEATPLTLQEITRDALLGNIPLNELTPRCVPGALAHMLGKTMHKTLTLETPSPSTFSLQVK